MKPSDVDHIVPIRTGCKLYHKTTWFETDNSQESMGGNDVANYITKLRGLKRKTPQIFYKFIAVANYITKLRGLKLKYLFDNDMICRVANYITKLRGLKPCD